LILSQKTSFCSVPPFALSSSLVKLKAVKFDDKRFLRIPMLTLLIALCGLMGDEPVPLGAKISNLSFTDSRYLPRSLDDFKDKKAFVLVFLERSCPVAKRYLPVIQQLHERFAGQGVQFLALNPSPDDTIVEMAAQAVESGVTFPLVKDFDGKAAKALGVSRVPTAIVLSADRKMVYRGRIDDQNRLSGSRSEPTRHDLQAALEEVLAGKPVSRAETPVDGCAITFETETVGTPVTYANHIAPILAKHCVECHKPGTVAPFSLTTYQNAKARAAAIVEVVRERRMPPWFAHAEYGSFVNERGLSDKERDLLAAWLKQGRPSGDLSQLPAFSGEISQTPEWVIQKPDLILPTQVYDLPATGDIEYKYAILPYYFATDTWVQEIQIKPESPKVVHHANLAFFVVGEKFNMNNFLTGFVPGGEPMRLQPGVAVKIPKGSVLGLQIHFVSTGKPEPGRVKVGLRFARGELNKQLHFRLLVDRKFAIPPGAPAHRVDASWLLPEDVVGLGLFCHMHVRGRDMTFVATKPGQGPETLLMVPNYSFDWQMPYRWAENSFKLPAGTRLDCIAHFDNSDFNPYNPNPKATVREGQQTHEEMMNGFFFYVAEKERLGIQLEGATGQALANKPGK
jgi:thiol-disulfide isomerase/thioredoxin